MKKTTQLITLLLLIISSTLYAKTDTPDSIYQSAIIGSWKQVVKDGPVTINATMIYHVNGTLDSTATVEVPGKKMNISISGTWEIKDGVMITTVKKTSANAPIPAGHVSKDQIIELNDKTFKFKNGQGNIEEQTKIKNP